MICYNWLKIYKESDRKPSQILRILDFIVYKEIPYNLNDRVAKRLSEIDWSGTSFIVNPEPILRHRRIFSDKELAEYVALASFRNLAEYKVTKQKTLNVSECPVDIESIKDNKLFSIANDKIYFRWEETNH